MKKTERGGADAQTRTLQCRNCGHTVTVKADATRATCSHCARIWNPQTEPIRGQRALAAASVMFGLALIALSGCAPKIEVASDTSWTGQVDGGSVAGRGASTFSVSGCAVFQKDTEAGYLKARAKKWFGPGKWVETTVPYGTVTVCP